MAIGTCLNTDDQARVRVIVGPYSVEFHSANVEIEMYDDALTMFIQVGEQVLPRLRTSTGKMWTMPYPSGTEVDGQCSPAAGTWVICEADEPVSYLVSGDMAELRWGALTWTITSGALARLLQRARRAQTALAQEADVSASTPDLEIPESEFEHEHATR
jgi:hypothetical protein